MTDMFDNRPWTYCKMTQGSELEEIELWVDEQEMDCLCQGVMQGTFEDPDQEQWFSIWSFGNEHERTMFLLRFGG